MSDAKVENKGSVPNSEAGRMLSRARRQALSRGGKTGAGQLAGAKAPLSTPQPNTRPPISATRAEPPARANPPANPAPPAHPVMDAGAEDCGCVHADEQKTAEQKALDEVCSVIQADTSSSPTVRQLCQQRRQALSSRGKTAQGKPGMNGMRRNGKWGAANALTGRDAARARREELCLNGRGDSPACRPTGRVRTTPVKVEEGTTLSGSLITGTQVDRSKKITGVPGSCRAITGTEYIGAEQFSVWCPSTPPPSPAKVGVGSTSRGQRVSGTVVGRSAQVTGDEHGACKSVTGNEYISSEQFESFCSNKPAPGPAKVGVSTTHTGQRVSGTEVGRSSKVTGDEPGACLKLTGTQYYQPDQSGAVCQGSGVPHKVSVMSTVRERPVTGTNVAANSRVTGSEYGACSTVTGTEYAGLEQYQACNRAPVQTPEKVVLSRTWRDQPVSGTPLEHNPKVTGDEYGACQPVSGTEYIGPGQYAQSCAPDNLNAARGRVATPRGPAGANMTGVGQGARNPSAQKKVTGSVRGEATRLSGTPYSDDAQVTASGGDNAGRHPLTLGQSERSATAEPSPAKPVQGNFSIMSPARTAQTSQISRITGTAYGAQGRITGPVNLATGLVSGTPEFRYKEDGAAAAEKPAPASPASLPHTSRITGEGREGGFAITGAGWRRGESITGTEGTSAVRRNPTQRGDQRSMAMQQIQAMKEREHVQIPPSKVTGSSGNAASGSTITYSGGARG